MKIGSFFALLTALLAFVRIAWAEDAPLTPARLEQELAKGQPDASESAQLAEKLRQWFGKEKLMQGQGVKTEGTTVVWAIEAPGTGGSVKVVSDDGAYTADLAKLSGTDVYVRAVSLPDTSRFHYHYLVDGKPMGGGEIEVYTQDPESLPNPSVPHGMVTKMPNWKSKIFADTDREWWVYVPAQYKPENPACVMVFQDGGGYLGSVPTVFDNLIARGDMPVTVGIFINPGKLLPGGTPRGNNQRSFEYDTLSDQYSRFLLEEILPEVEKTTKLRHDAASRAVSGLSSGGICAFTVAWQKPDQFSKVLSWIGSFTNLAAGDSGIAGGHNYPFMIRRMDKKPIRVFLQDGDQDLDNFAGNWPLANQNMAKALAFKGYDYKFVFGHGSHSSKHGTALLPSSLRWLWQDYKPQ